MREVKREFKQRRKAEKERAEAADAYWRAETGRAPRRSGRGTALAVVASVAVVAAGGAAVWLLSRPSSSTGAAASGRSSTSAPSAPASAGSSAAASTSAASTPPPFEGTPARDWPVGAQGVVPPKPAQIGIFSRAQVADAYEQAAGYVRASMLDASVVSRGRLDPVFDAIGPVSTQWVRQQHARTAEGRSELPWTYLANRFRPQDWEPTTQVRIKGRMTAKAVGSRLRIRFVYVSAYWLEPRGPGIGRAVAVRRSGSMEFLGAGPDKAGPMYFGGSTWTTTSSVCGSGWRYENYLEAYVQRPAATVPAPAATVPAPTATAWDPTDVDAPEPAGDGCFTDSSGFS
jgi:hypothetical protein